MSVTISFISLSKLSCVFCKLGWHLCSNCKKNAHYMCFTCTFSLCKGCIKEAVILCIRGNKGFCESCMNLVMLIEKEEHVNQEMVLYCTFIDYFCFILGICYFLLLIYLLNIASMIALFILIDALGMCNSYFCIFLFAVCFHDFN